MMLFPHVHVGIQPTTVQNPSQYSSQWVWMTVFLLLSDLLGNVIQSAGLDTAALVFATLTLGDCSTASNCDLTPRSICNMANDQWFCLLCEPFSVLWSSWLTVASSLVMTVQAFGSNFSNNLIDQASDLWLWGLNHCNNCFFWSTADHKTEEEACEIGKKCSVTFW